MRRFLCILVLTMLLSAPALAEVFPDKPYYGMQIDYKLEGIAATGFEDRETARTVTRLLEGIVTGDKVRISGVAHCEEDDAELTISISAGFEYKKDSFKIKRGKGKRDFSLDVEVPPNARGSHISVLINPQAPDKNLVKALRLDVTAVPKR